MPLMVSSGSIPPPANILRQITAAPTKEIAKGTKIKVLATTPQETESASAAIKRPKMMQVDGTKMSHIRLLRIARRNCKYPSDSGSQRKA